jgi:hypothetical protein
MNTKIQFTSIVDLPDIFVRFLLGKSLISFNNGLKNNYNLSKEQSAEINKIEGGLLFRTIEVESLSEEIRARLKIIDDEKIKNICQEVYDEFCGPVRWYFPDLENRLKNLGFELVNSDLFPIPQPETSFADAVVAIFAKIGDLPPSIKAKIQKIIEDSLKNQWFDADALRQLLSKAVSDGGIGLGNVNTNVILTQLRDYITLYKFSDIPDKNDWTAPKKELPPTLDPATIPKDILSGTEAEDLGGAATQAANAVATAPLSLHQNELVQAVLGADSLQDRSEDLQKRWKMIVEARIGGARDAAKTRSMLELSEAAGGLGLSASEALRLANLLEQTASSFEKRREEFSVIEKNERVKNQAAAIMAGPEANDRKTQAQLNERFVAMFGKGAVEEMRRETRREIESPEKAHPGESSRSHVAPFNLNPAPVAAPQSVSAPAAPAAPVNAEAPKYVPKVPDKLRALIDADSPIFPLKAPAAPVQKKSADIRPGMKLIGPVDELRTMSLVDFRRLSNDVSVRIQKIRSRIEVIAEDGPHEKIRAIQAFEQSDPVRLYREILKRSLIEQKSTEVLCEEYKKQGKEFLDLDEITALRQFLTQIRYSSM